jgi:hypothetical protein
VRCDTRYPEWRAYRMSLAGMGLAAQAASRQFIASNSVSCLRRPYAGTEAPVQ